MTSYGDMTYDEQRAFLGLWQPTPGYLWERVTRNMRPIVDGFRALFRPTLVVDVRDYALARGDRR